jgi:acyl dehydratase
MKNSQRKELDFQDISAGDEIFKLVKKPVSKLQLIRYAGASGDFNPIHVDPSVGIEQITHGMLIMGFAGEAITSCVPKKYLRKFSVRFTGITKPDDVITITGKVKEKTRVANRNILICTAIACNQRGEPVLTGFFEVEFPGP